MKMEKETFDGIFEETCRTLWQLEDSRLQPPQAESMVASCIAHDALRGSNMRLVAASVVFVAALAVATPVAYAHTTCIGTVEHPTDTIEHIMSLS